MTDLSFGTACTYCESDLAAYDPVFVAKQRGSERVPTGQFCNYACLSAYIDKEELVYGDACTFDPSA